MAREGTWGNNTNKGVHAYKNAQKGNDAFAAQLFQLSSIYIQLLLLATLAFAAFMILLPGA